MLQNDKVTVFTVSELLTENQQGGGGEFFTPPHSQIRVKHGPILSNNNSYNILRLFTKCWFRQKRNKMVIINKKHGIYKLSQELPNDLILRIEKN